MEAKKEELDEVDEVGERSHVTRSASAPVDFDLPVFPDFLDEDQQHHVTPMSPVSTDIDNLGSCPCCSQSLTVSLVHHNTGLITCNNLDVSRVIM